MTTALEDQLLEARTQVDDLTRDYHAQTELLTEAISYLLTHLIQFTQCPE
jgi:hypothetical protein